MTSELYVTAHVNFDPLAERAALAREEWRSGGVAAQQIAQPRAIAGPRRSWRSPSGSWRRTTARCARDWANGDQP